MKYNYILVSACSAWFLAQIIKTVTILIRDKKFVPERIYGPGGMPSGHSAMVCGAVVAVARECGTDTPIFAVMTMFALVVMYDAVGVRREAGNHARELNRIKKLLKYDLMETDSEKKQEQKKDFKEILGHTPLQVVCGAALGIVMAFIIPMKIGG